MAKSIFCAIYFAAGIIIFRFYDISWWFYLGIWAFTWLIIRSVINAEIEERFLVTLHPKIEEYQRAWGDTESGQRFLQTLGVDQSKASGGVAGGREIAADLASGNYSEVGGDVANAAAFTGIKVVFGMMKRAYENRGKTSDQVAFEGSIRDCFVWADSHRSNGSWVSVLMLVCFWFGEVAGDWWW